MDSRLFDKALVGSTEEGLDLITSVLESSTEYSIIGTDAAGRIVLWNEGARRVYGYEPEEMVGRGTIAMLHAPEAAAAGQPEQTLAAALSGGKWEGLTARVRKDGSRFTARVVITPRFSQGGVPVGFLIISRDITDEQRLAEADLRMEALRASEARFRGFLESAPDAIIITDQDGRIVLINPQSERMFGYTASELAGQSIDLLVPPALRGVHAEHRRGYLANPHLRPMGMGLELFGVRKDGGTVPVQISLSPMTSDEGVLVMAVIRDITERKQFEQALREKAVELENANYAKDRFLASMSHELRTPLNAVIGFTGTLLMKLPGPLNEDQEKQLRTIQTSAKHLLSLINDLLDLAKIESGRIELRKEPVSCREIVEEVVTSLRPQAAVKELKLEVRPWPEEITVNADRRALKQILLNLCNNAIKYTERGGVTLAWRRVRDTSQRVTVFDVSDTGIGIRPEHQARLFRAFEQIAEPGGKRYEGTGLGLHLSQKLALLMGGQVTFRSEHGKGSTFTLTLTEE